MRRAVMGAAFAIIPLMVLSHARATSDPILDAVGPTPPRAAAIYDMQEQRFLGTYRETRLFAPASLLKMVTALVVADRLQPTNELVISPRAANADADRVIWREGARFTVDQVLHGMLLESSNGAAYALAERAYGSIPRFREGARELLTSIGATETVLIDPSGLDAPGQHSTARDLALVASAVLADPWLSGIVALNKYELPWSNGGTAIFRNANPYLARDPTAVGVKNGFTSKARNTVAAAAERGGRTHIVVVLGGPDPFDQARQLMDVAFELAPGRPEPVTQDAPAPTPVLHEAIAPVSRPVAPQRSGSPTFLRFLVGSAFAAYTIGLVHVNRRRARKLQRLVRLGEKTGTLRACPTDQRSQSSRPRPSSRKPRAPVAHVSSVPTKQTGSSGRSRASLRS